MYEAENVWKEVIFDLLLTISGAKSSSWFPVVQIQGW